MQSQKLAVLEPGGLRRVQPADRRARTPRSHPTDATLIEIHKATLAAAQASPSLVEKLDAIMVERRRHTADHLVSTPDAASAGSAVSLRARIARFFGLTGAS
jgi:hypothetical protein